VTTSAISLKIAYSKYHLAEKLSACFLARSCMMRDVPQQILQLSKFPFRAQRASIKRRA
jgi:hypothetical protein